MLLQSQKRNIAKLAKRWSFQNQLPPPSAYKKTLAPDQIFIDESNKPRRMVFYEIAYQKQQVAFINQIKKHLNIKYPNHELTDQVILKHSYAGKWNIQTIMQRLQQLIQFLNNPKVVQLSQKTIQKLQNTFMYPYGFDKKSHPVVIMRVDLIDFNQPLQQMMNSVYYIMLVIIGYKMVPYYTQKMTLIVDFNDMSMIGVPYLTLYQIMKKIGIYFCGFLYKVFCFNTKGISTLWHIIKRFLTQTQRKRVTFIDKGQEYATTQFINVGQLQRKYGGQLPNLIQYWPPRNPNQAFSTQDASDVYQSQYYSVNNDEDFFHSLGQPQSNCNCCCQIY